MKNVISSLSEGLWIPNLAGWWLRMRGPHPQSHVTQDHVVLWQIKNVIYPHSQGSWPPKIGRVLTQDEGTSPKKSRYTSILQSRDNSKTSYFLNHKACDLQTQHDEYLGWGVVTRKAKWHLDLKKLYLHFHIAYSPWHWLKMREHHIKIYNSRDTWQIENVMHMFLRTR